MANDSDQNYKLDDAFETWTHNHVVIFLAFEGVVFIVNVVCGVIVMCSNHFNKRPPNIILGSMCFTESFVILQVIFITIMGRFGVDISCVTTLFLYQAGRISVLLHVQLLTLERLIATFRSANKVFKRLISRTGRVLSILLSNVLSVILMVPIYILYCDVEIHERCKYSEVFGDNEEPAMRYFRLLNCSMFFVIIVEYISLAKLLKSKLPKVEPKNKLQDSNYSSLYDDHKGSVSDGHLPGLPKIEVKDVQNDIYVVKNSVMTSIYEEHGQSSNTNNTEDSKISYNDRNKENFDSSNYDLKKILKREIREMEINENEPEIILESSAVETRKLKKMKGKLNIFKRSVKNAQPKTNIKGNPEWRKTVFRTITFVVVMSSVLCLPYLVTQIMIWTTPTSVNKDQSRVINNIFISFHALMHGIVHLTVTTKPGTLCKSCRCSS